MNNYIQIPREGDIPYWLSPPIQYVYTSQASLVAGQYIWADPPSSLTPIRPVINTSLYYFRDITLSADIEEDDFSAALKYGSMPYLGMYLRSNANANLFREPFYMPRYVQNFGYRLFWETHQTPDELLAAFTGTLTQTPALIGKTTISLTAIISAQEISDPNYRKAFHQMYPATGTR